MQHLEYHTWNTNSRIHNLKDSINILLAIFYADDGYITSRSKQQLQDAMELVGLRTNTSKTKGMTCVPGKIRTRLSEEVYSNSRVGFHSRRDWERRIVECDKCGLELRANSLRSHLETQHGVYQSRVLNRDLVDDRPSQTYRAHQTAATGQYVCPVPNCVGSLTTPFNLRKHFIDRHPKDKVWIQGEGCYEKCHRCGLQSSPHAFMTTHYPSALCHNGEVREAQREAAAESVRALDVTFTAYGEELERVEMFKYLGRLMAMDDNDVPAVRSNIKKARKCWARISRVLRADNTNPRVAGMFYKAVVQAILLFGSETWSISPTARKQLEGFHVRAAWRMAKINKPRLDPETDTWRYPDTEELTEHEYNVNCRH